MKNSAYKPHIPDLTELKKNLLYMFRKFSLNFSFTP